MHALPEIQARFYAAMSLPQSEPAVDDLLRGAAAKNARRIAAYRRNISGNMSSALALTYPVIQRIVGDIFFREVARAYALFEPSRSGDLNDYGANFSSFIESYPHAAALSYLVDVARLEWQLQALALATDVTDSPTTDGAPFAALATTPADRYDALFFTVDLAVLRMNSIWPLDEIWRVNQIDYVGDMQIDFTQNCQLLLWRTPRGTQLTSLSKAEAALLYQLLAGHALAGAVELALEQDVDFDLGSCLQRWIAAGVLRGAYCDLDRR